MYPTKMKRNQRHNNNNNNHNHRNNNTKHTHPWKSKNSRPVEARHNTTEKVYFKLLQAIHHAEIIEMHARTGDFPAGMMKQINRLTSFIKPSSPNETTKDKIRQNTDRWMRANMNILKHHYDEIIASLIQDLPSYHAEALEKAITFGKARYGRKLTRSSVLTLTNLVSESSRGREEEERENPFDFSQEEEWPALGQQHTLRGEGTPERARPPQRKQTHSVTTSKTYLTYKSKRKDLFNTNPRQISRLYYGDDHMSLGNSSRPQNTRPQNSGKGTVQGPENSRSQAHRPRAARDLVTRHVTHSPPRHTLNSNPSRANMNRNHFSISTQDPSPAPSPNLNLHPKPQRGPKSNRQAQRTAGLARGPQSPNPNPILPLNPNPNPLPLSNLNRRFPHPKSALKTHSFPTPNPNLGGRNQLEVRVEVHEEEDRGLLLTPISEMAEEESAEEEELSLPQKSHPHTSSPVVTHENDNMDEEHNHSYTVSETPEKDHGRSRILTHPELGPDSDVAVRMSDTLSDSLGVDGELEAGTLMDEMGGTLPCPLVSPPPAASSCPSPPGLSRPPTSLVKPTRHSNTVQKIKNWSLHVKKPIVVLGDSNLSRIPAHEFLDIQIDSFPGAQIHHLRGILEKTPRQDKVEKVILAVGLNNCLRNNLFETMKKQYQQLFTTTQKTFPHAQIHFPLIQYSNTLSLKTQRLLEEVNVHLLKHFNTLSWIGEDVFAVNAADGIHWTAETASRILDNWMHLLN